MSQPGDIHPLWVRSRVMHTSWTGTTVIYGLSGRRTSLGVLQRFWRWRFWVRQSRLFFKTWVETTGAITGPRPGWNMAELQLWRGQALWPQPKAAPSGRGRSWHLSPQWDTAAPATPDLSQPWAPQPGGGCSRGLAPVLKKTWNKESPSASEQLCDSVWNT